MPCRPYNDFVLLSEIISKAKYYPCLVMWLFQTTFFIFSSITTSWMRKRVSLKIIKYRGWNKKKQRERGAMPHRLYLVPSRQFTLKTISTNRREYIMQFKGSSFCNLHILLFLTALLLLLSMQKGKEKSIFNYYEAHLPPTG